ncbi:LOW QUALITY PROTEIN: olfactory receptor 52B2-like [Anomalospiza imberbis]|uniref:LOW QUALITY PROTEIN: olfactory receptor 52B2-like n=1 Tax=Anomalospiza imberbis TaxID=187417 RepID=UPI00358EFD9D
MPPSNLSSLTPDTVILTGIPGMEQLHVWISIPFCSVYVAALLGNGVLLLTMWTERSLQRPTYLFLAVLAVADLTLSTTAVPKMLALFWFRAREISFSACLTQMFFLHFTTVAELKILLAMAFDRFAAICFLLRYGAVLTPTAVAKTGLAALLRSFCIISPCVFLLRRLPFCGRTVIALTYCEHAGVACLACADISANVWYGLAVPFSVALLDLALIAVSYGFILLELSRLPSRPARRKAPHTCGSHACVLLLFHAPAVFTALTQCFGRSIPPELHILLANLYVLLPPLLNPAVYGVRTRQTRDRVLKVFVRPRSRLPRQERR